MNDWSAYPVPVLAGFLEGDLESAWTQVMTWRQTHDVLTDAAASLARARAELAGGWPAEVSEAAARFLDFADSLTASMTATAEAAHVNGTALAGTLEALSTAKSRVDALHATWRTYVAQTGGDVSSAVFGGEEAAPAGWADQLNTQAQHEMSTADDAIFDSTRMLIIPDVIRTNSVFEPIKPLSNVSSEPTTTALARRGSGTQPTNDPGTGYRFDAERIYGGTAASEMIGGASKRPIADEPAVPQQPSGKSMPRGTRSIRAAAAPRRTKAGRVIGADRPTPSVADVGLAPKSPAQDPSEGNTAATLTEPGSSDLAPGMLAPTMGGRLPNGDNRPTRRRTQNEVWPVREGVAPVLQARQAPIHDPGPDVLGIDR
jgi:hypothetical protein